MKLLPSLALTLTLAAALSAQTPQFTDPANLRGEYPSRQTGRELPIDQGAVGLEQLLRKLNTRASLMLIVAHPDDEDGGMLTLYSRGMGARVADLSLNRGEGGQNAMTGDFEDALGLLRTQELLSADRYSGVDQFFGTEVDFGFSKTKEESFAKWGHDRVLYDVVRSIRLYRPLVIASVFIGGVTDGHGQHQVAGQIAQEAFLAAGDPKVFPDQIAEGILPWQPLKVYARVPTQSITPQGLYDYATNQYAPARFTNYVTGEVTTTAPLVDVVIHEGATDPLLTRSSAAPEDLASSYLAESSTKANASEPLSYVQFARIGLGLQKSQIGPGVRLAPTGAFDIAYHLYGSMMCDAPQSVRPPSWTPQTCHPELRPVEKPAPSSATAQIREPFISENEGFFESIDTSLNGIAALAPDFFSDEAKDWQEFTDHMNEAVRHFDSRNPAANAQELAQAAVSVETIYSKLQASAYQGPPQIAEAFHEIAVKKAQLNQALILALNVQIKAESQSDAFVVGSKIPAQIKVSTDESSMTQAFVGFTATNESFACLIPNRPDLDYLMPAALTSPQQVSCVLPPSFSAQITRPYFYKSNVDSTVYEMRDRKFQGSAVGVNAIYATVILGYKNAWVVAGTPLNQAGQAVKIVPPVSLSLSPAQVVPRTKHGIDVTLHVRTLDDVAQRSAATLDMPDSWVSIPTKAPLNLSSTTFHVSPRNAFRETENISAHVNIDGQSFAEGYRSVGYPGIPYTNYYTPATTRIIPVDLRLPERHRIGYLPGTGDAVPDALASIGLAPTVLTLADLTAEKLKAFDTVILGVRTFNAHPNLHGAPTQALLDFARAGGNVLVQYQSPEFTAADAPYPLSLGSNEKVVDETAEVHLLTANAPQFTAPNSITAADFNGWVEERGHGFLATWDDRYTALTETRDPGQAPQRGGLITTKLGKGRWTYCAFALYRQLPEAVPGAFRLFVNLLNPTN